MYPLYAGFNCTNAQGVASCFGQLIHERSLISHVGVWLAEQGHRVLQWLMQPRMCTPPYNTPLL